MNQDDTNKKENKKINLDIRPYMAIGLTMVLVFIICITIFFVVYRFKGFSMVMGKVGDILQPIVIGLIFAYLMNPVMTKLENLLGKHVFTAVPEKTKTQKTIIRAICMALTFIIYLGLIALFCMFFVPQVVTSVIELVTTFNDRIAQFNGWLNGLSDGSVIHTIQGWLTDASGSIVNWIYGRLGENSDQIIKTVTSGAYKAGRFVVNLIIALAVAGYVLMSKESFKGQTKKIIYAIFRPKAGNFVLDYFRKADSIFGGFFIGKIIDSIIIWLIALVALSIMKMPYAVLVSVIIGVTNIIPFFGPYIGAVPSAIIIFIVSPLQGLEFIAFVFILQQVDGNFIGPKILGDSTGLSPFWVIFSILVFGGCFGIVGMIFGVPIFAMVYYTIKLIVEYMLKRRGLPTETVDYTDMEGVDIDTNTISYERKQISEEKSDETANK